MYFLKFGKFSALILFFWWDSGLNSGLHSHKAGTLLLEPHHLSSPLILLNIYSTPLAYISFPSFEEEEKVFIGLVFQCYPRGIEYYIHISNFYFHLIFLFHLL
jgi:hypothetical protein